MAALGHRQRCSLLQGLVGDGTGVEARYLRARQRRTDVTERERDGGGHGHRGVRVEHKPRWEMELTGGPMLSS